MREQLEELRRGAAAGDAALREAAKLKKMLEGALWQPICTSDHALGRAAATMAGALPATPTAAAESGEDGHRGHGVSAGAGHETDSLVELAERLLRRAGDVDRELESVREALTTAR